MTEPPGKPATTGEIAACRSPINQVLVWIVEGQQDGDVLAAIKKHWPGEDPDKVYEAAIDQIAEASKVESDVILGWCLMARRELYRKMFEMGDYTGALRATEKIESLATKLGRDVKEAKKGD